MRIGFIGGGVMAEAIISGIIKSEVLPSADIMVSDISEGRLEQLQKSYDVNVVADNKSVVEFGSVIFVAVKPQDINSVGQGISNQLTAKHTIVSIAAGVAVAQLQTGFNTNSVIRVMPNTPAQVQCGMSVWMCATGVPEDHKDIVTRVLEGIGKQYLVQEEKYIDMATGLSASGPAYILMVIDALADAGVLLGMSREMSKMLAVQMVKGTAELIDSSDVHIKELSDRVVSPGGTTAAGLLVLESAGVPHAIMKAVEAAYNKSLELGK
tara:strand:- start:47570 stop:48370 length:801 start_codon:yes stop_codon:yes gene_type:complete